MLVWSRISPTVAAVSAMSEPHATSRPEPHR